MVSAMDFDFHQPEVKQWILLRQAERADIHSMASVVVNAWRFAYTDFLPADMMEEWVSQERFISRFRENWHLPNFRLVACGEEGTILGFALQRQPCKLDGFDAEIGGLYIDPSASRKGIGKLLVKAMVEYFIGSGHRSMAIHTLAENKIGCAFYEKIGGMGHSFTDWNGVPGKWYVWPDLSLIGESLRLS